MSSVQEMQRVDRELFLELIESPINPAFLHMSTPLKRYDPMFMTIARARFEIPARVKTDPILNNHLTQTMENNARSDVRGL